ncbi:hypothetical protein K9M41_02745 [Candidatus Gracilibacteria bacterium]|nr:hypothetical protein [Candidatus Gracilibacteria bacterium]
MAKPVRKPKTKEILDPSGESEVELLENKEIEYRLDKLDNRSKTEVNLEHHRQRTESSKKRNPDKLIRVSEKLAPELRQHRETIEKSVGAFQDEKELKDTLDSLERFQRERETLSWIVGKSSSALETPKDLFDNIVDKYVDSESTVGGHFTPKFRTFAEVIGEDPEEKNVFKRILWVIKHPIEFVKYHTVKQKRKELLLYSTAEYLGGKVKESAEKGLEIEQEVEVAWDETKESRNRLAAMRLNGKQQRSIEKRRLKATKEVEKFKAKMQDNLQKTAQFGPEKLSWRMADDTEKIAQKLSKLGPEGIELAQKCPGLKVRHGRAGTVLAFSSYTIKEAIQAKSFGGAVAAVTSRSFLSEAAEMLPVWGSIKSFQRLTDYSTGISKTGRWLEFGLNIGLDAWTAISMVPAIIATIGTFGAGSISIPAILAARGVAGKAVTKLIARKFTKEGLEELATIGLKKGSKFLGEEGGEGILKTAEKTITKEAKEIGGKSLTKAGAKEVALQASKNILSKMTPKNWQSLWPLIRWQLGYEVLASGVGWALTNFPIKEKAIQVAENQVRSNLSEQQNRVIDIAKERI